MAIEMNIPAVIAKAKAKVALLEKLQVEQKQYDEDYQKQTDITRETRKKEYHKWAVGAIKQYLRKPSNLDSLSVGKNYRGDATVEFRLPSDVVNDEPNWDEVLPYPTRKYVEFPRMYNRQGHQQSVDQTIHDLKNSIEWLSCIEPDTKFTVSEFNRITASL
jgi:hypothetical protein